MSETPVPGGLVARLRRRGSAGWIWLVPAAAAVLVLWLGWQALADRGPAITITFADAEGLDVEHVPIRYKNVQVGTVENVKLSKDLSKVIVTARMERKVADQLTSSTAFWVVKPRLTAGGISGLSTLVSGSYMAMDPGDGHGARVTSFRGLEEPPLVHSSVPGSSFTLDSDQLGSLDTGTSVFYRGITVGSVQGYHLAADGKSVTIYVFVNAPYDRLVHANSHFWNAGGFSLASGAGGFKANIPSLQTLIGGGIDFDSPEVSTGAPASGAHFLLYGDGSSADQAPTGPAFPYRLTFPGTVEGVGRGTAVTLLGLRVGRVTDVHLEYDLSSGRLTTPVTVAIEPGLIQLKRGGFLGGNQADLDRVLSGLIRDGLRAQLASGSLITGSKEVSLEEVPDAAPALLGAATTDTAGLETIPTLPGRDLGAIEDSAARLMAKLASLPLPEIMGDLRRVADRLDHVSGSPEMAQAASNLARSLANLQGITASANAQLPALLTSLRQTSQAASGAANAASKLVGGDPAGGGEVPAMIRELTEAARSIRDLTDYLDRHPEALLRGRTAGK